MILIVLHIRRKGSTCKYLRKEANGLFIISFLRLILSWSGRPCAKFWEKKYSKCLYPSIWTSMIFKFHIYIVSTYKNSFGGKKCFLLWKNARKMVKNSKNFLFFMLRRKKAFKSNIILVVLMALQSQDS